jgi:hypothetical protein
MENKPTLWNGSIHIEHRTKPNRTEPDRACSLIGVCFYSPADDRFYCAIGLTSSSWNACFFLQWVQICWIAKF